MTKRQKNSVWLLLIIGINLVVYFPALKHLPRSDQFLFLMETVENDHLGDLIKQTYSYTRTRHYALGDENQFKPLYFGILSFEKWLYGFKFVYWQLTSLCLHVLVVWQLYKIFSFIQPSRLAGLVAISFSVLHISQEMVVYDHMAPYLMFMTLLLKAVWYLGRFIKGGQNKSSLFFKMLICLSIACFIHEYAVVCIMVMIFALFLDRKFFLKKERYKNYVNIFWLFVPIAVYVSWSLIDYSSKVGAFSFVLSKPQASFSIIGTIFKIFILSIVTPIIPAFLNMRFGARLFTKSFDLENIVGNFHPQDFWSNLNVLIVISLGFWSLLFLKKFFQNFCQGKVDFRIESKSSLQKSRLFIGMVSLSLGLAYICMITFGRFMERGIEYLQMNLYYFYTIILFNIIFFYCFYWWVDKGEKKKGFNSWLLIGVLGGLIVLNSVYTYRLNLKMAQAVSGLRKRFVTEISPRQYYLAHRYVASGINAMKRNNYELAFSYFDEALMVDPKSYLAYMNKGIALVNEKNYGLAVEEFEKSLRINPGHPDTYYNLGIAYMEQKKFPLAVEQFSQAIKLKQEFKNAYLNRANIYCLYGMYKRAIVDYTKVIEIAPKDPGGYYNRAMTYQDMGQLQYALKDKIKAESLRQR